MLKYKYGFDKLTKKDMWIEQSTSQEQNISSNSLSNEFSQQKPDENVLTDGDEYAIYFGLNADEYEEISENAPVQVPEIYDELQMKQTSPTHFLEERHCTKNILFNRKYFIMLSKTNKGIEAKCCSCAKHLKGYGSSTSNFLNHLKVVSATYFTIN